jgi:SnoaL-like domain
MIRQYKDLILQAYEAFNERNISLVLSLMHPAVNWPNEWKGGRLSGQAEIEAYWTKQFEVLDPTVTPLSIRERKGGQIEVQVRQLVKDLSGNIAADNHVLHVYTMEDGLIRSMQVEYITELV